MKVNSSIVVAFVVGAVLASLPYTLSSGKTVAQGAGPAQSQGFPPSQGGFQGGPQGVPPGLPGQGRLGGQAMVNSMTTAGEFLFAASGDTIYKIRINNMQIEGQTRLPQNRPQQGGVPGQNRGGAGRPGNSGGNGNIPPK